MLSPRAAPLRTSQNAPSVSPPYVDASPTMPNPPSAVTTPAASVFRVGSQERTTALVDVAAIAGVATGGVVRDTAGSTHATKSKPSTIKGRTPSIQNCERTGSAPISARIGASLGR